MLLKRIHDHLYHPYKNLQDHQVLANHVYRQHDFYDKHNEEDTIWI